MVSMVILEPACPCKSLPKGAIRFLNNAGVAVEVELSGVYWLAA